MESDLHRFDRCNINLSLLKREAKQGRMGDVGWGWMYERYEGGSTFI